MFAVGAASGGGGAAGAGGGGGGGGGSPLDILGLAQKLWMTGMMAIQNFPENYQAFTSEMAWTVFDVDVPWEVGVQSCRFILFDVLGQLLSLPGGLILPLLLGCPCSTIQPPFSATLSKTIYVLTPASLLSFCLHASMAMRKFAGMESSLRLFVEAALATAFRAGAQTNVFILPTKDLWTSYCVCSVLTDEWLCRMWIAPLFFPMLYCLCCSVILLCLLHPNV